MQELSKIACQIYIDDDEYYFLGINGVFDFIYKTRNKHERIIGYKDDFIICLSYNNLYRINVNTHKEERFAKINVSDAIFEICGNKILVWNDNKYYG